MAHKIIGATIRATNRTYMGWRLPVLGATRRPKLLAASFNEFVRDALPNRKL